MGNVVVVDNSSLPLIPNTRRQRGGGDVTVQFDQRVVKVLEKAG
jgi:hypothetical protein